MKSLSLAILNLLFCFCLTSQATYEIIKHEENELRPYPLLKGALGSQDSIYIYADSELAIDSIETDYDGDGLAGTIYDGCEVIKNDIEGKLAIIVGGECPDYIKAFNAQKAGAIAALICADVFHVTIEPNLGPNGEGSDVTIPVFTVAKAYCLEFLGAHDCPELPLSIVFEIVQKDSIGVCEYNYPENVFWGNQPGEGDFSIPFEASGWTSISRTPNQDLFIWNRLPRNIPEFPRYFGADQQLNSPTSNCGTASFSSITGLIYESGPTSLPPYTTFKSDLISPSIDCSGKDHVMLDYYQLYNRLNQRSKISFSNDDGLTWSNPITIRTENIVQDVLNTEHIQLAVPEFYNQPNCRIKFLGEDDAYYLMIDDIVLKDTIIEIFDILAWYELPMQQYSSSLPPVLHFGLKGKNESNIILDSFKIVVSVYDTLGSLLHQQISNEIALNLNEEFDIFYPNTFIPHENAGLLTIQYEAMNGMRILDKESYEVAVSDSYLSILLNKDDYKTARIIDRLKLFGNEFHYEHYNLSPNDKVKVKGIKFLISALEPDIPYTISANLFEWIDENLDKTIQPKERAFLINNTVEISGDFDDLIPFITTEGNEFVYTVKENTSLVYIIDLDYPDNLLLNCPYDAHLNNSQIDINRAYADSLNTYYGLNYYFNNFYNSDKNIALSNSILIPNASSNYVQLLDIEKQDPLNVKQIEKDKVTFYPNPTNGFVHFPDINNRPVLILDLNSKVVMETSIIDFKLDLGELGNGLYIMIDQTTKAYLGKILLYE